MSNRGVKKHVISLFDYTGNMIKPWVDAGYDGHCVDIRNGDDIFDWVPPRHVVEQGVVFMSAFPPCDHLAVSGARWFRGKGLGKLVDSIRLFERAAFWCEWFGAPYMIENPVSTISTYWRPPDYTFHPYQYTGFELEDNYTKKTCLWTGNGFVMPEPAMAHMDEPDDRIHKAVPGPERADFRSATPMGFARAVFEANSKDAQSCSVLVTT